MTLQSRWAVPIPRCSLQQWIFGSACDPIPDSDKPLYIDAERPETHQLTKTQFRLLAKQIALGLIDAGLGQGDRVLVYSPNNIYYPSVFLSILMGGGIFTGANPGFTKNELAYQLKDSGSTFMFAAPSQISTALEAAELAGLPSDRIFILDYSIPPPFQRGAPRQPASKAGPRCWTELLSDTQDRAQTWQWVEPKDPSQTTCCLNYSSGTTGVPKGVEIVHSSYIANGVGVIHVADLEPDIVEERKRARGLCFLPMYHAYAQTYFVSIYPFLGTPIYVMASFQFEKMLQHVQQFRITTLMCVPPILVHLAKQPIVKKYDLSSVEHVNSGAAPLSYDLAHGVERLWADGSINVKQGWGMTEVTCTCMTWDPRVLCNAAAVGELAPNCSARIMELDGKTMIEEPNKRGELWVTGPTLMKGYWKNPSATASTIHVDADGTRWLKTGDIAYAESFERGAVFHIVDRIKELIKVKGNQVAPAELEAILLDHDQVVDAAVVGVQIHGDEVPRAYIVKVPGSQLTEQQVVEWMEARVVKHKRLKGGVGFVEMIPKNPSGKILRRALREKAKKDFNNDQAIASRL
ncbi:hypothetical protein NM208_g214 [Fusarium decemcellulare]|uniref:Uncharacterized protein n=1 Tax=Fusarium decemcellulare TaxID=57161 RepID=A0ACC1T0H8_9HYPO|nr:hypothetical protein NM208_g214 [Fusarium decemcellulare]